jgi:hypothetical protein
MVQAAHPPGCLAFYYLLDTAAFSGSFRMDTICHLASHDNGLRTKKAASVEALTACCCR